MHLARLHDDNTTLRARVRELETQLGEHHVLSDDQLLAQLPGRTGRVLESAIDAANEIVAQAKKNARRLEDEAGSRADALLSKADERATALSQRAYQRAQELIRTTEAEHRGMMARIDEQRTVLVNDLAVQRGALEVELAELHRKLLDSRQAHDDALQTIDSITRQLGTASLINVLPGQPGLDVAVPDGAARLRPFTGVPGEAVDSFVGLRVDLKEDDDAHAFDTPTEVLFVCTHNVFRSPVAAKLLSRRLAQLSIPAIVRSAGIEHTKHHMSGALKAMLKTRDIDLDRHRCKLVSPQGLGKADLVLAMTGDHVVAIRREAPAHSRRIFTLKELVRRGEQLGPRRSGETLAAWLDRVNAGRGELAGIGRDDDLEDPKGASRVYYEQLIDELAALIDRLLGLLWQEDMASRQWSGHTVGRRLGFRTGGRGNE